MSLENHLSDLENIHLYFGVNLERVWLVVKEDIPQIKPRIKNVLIEQEEN